MDMQMPVMDGVKACRQIMSREGDHRKSAVMFVTAHVCDSYEKESQEAGGVGFLPNPFNLGAIERCFQRPEHTWNTTKIT
jgi:CheY-like chemotaxis protein